MLARSFLLVIIIAKPAWKPIRPRLEKTKGEVVPRGGLEPPRLAAPDFESGTSTNSITGAGVCSGKTALKLTKR